MGESPWCLNPTQRVADNIVTLDHPYSFSYWSDQFLSSCKKNLLGKKVCPVIHLGLLLQRARKCGGGYSSWDSSCSHCATVCKARQAEAKEEQDGVVRWSSQSCFWISNALERPTGLRINSSCSLSLPFPSATATSSCSSLLPHGQMQTAVLSLLTIVSGGSVFVPHPKHMSTNFIFQF